MAEYYNERSLLAGVNTPQMNVGDLTKAGSIVAQSLKSQRDREIEDAKLANEQKRWDITNARAEAQEARSAAEFDRRLNEQKAVDAYNTERAKGVQSIGGVYGDRLAQASGQYDLTPAEIEWTKANGVDVNVARKVGNEALAKKLDWQTNVSNNVEPFLQSGAGNESRADMYERINKSVLDKGLTPTSEMVNSLDAARLAEIEAKKAKDKVLQEQQDTANKSNVDIMKWAIGQQGGGSGVPTYDTEGNVTGYTGAAADKRAIKVDDKYDVSKAKGERDILEYIKDNKAGDKGTARVDSIKLYKEILASDSTIDPESAAAAVTAGVGIDKGAWYNPWSEDKTSYKPTAAQDLVPLLKGTRTPESVVGTTGVGGQSNKAILAEELAKQVTNSNKATLDKTAGSKAELLKSDKEVTNDKVDAWLRGRGLIDKPKSVESTTKATDSNSEITTKMPKSLQDAEGVKYKPYKDSGGVVTVGVGYAFNKPMEEVKSDFKAAGIPEDKIKGLMNMDGSTALTPEETGRLADVSYDRHGVQKLARIGIDVSKMNPVLAEIGVGQAFRGDVVKGDKGYKGDLYELLKRDDLVGMKEYVDTNKSLPVEVKQRMDKVFKREGPITKEQYEYDNKKSKVLDLIANTPERVDSAASRIGNDEVLREIENKAANVKENTREFDELQKQYEARVDSIRKDTRGIELSNYMNRQKSSPGMDRVNQVIIEGVKSIPSAIREIVPKPKGNLSKAELEELMRSDEADGSRPATTLKSILSRNKLQGIKEVDNTTPYWYTRD